MNLPERNKAVIERFFHEVFNQNREEVIPELIASEYRDHGSNPPLEGPDGARANLRGLRSGFSDVRFELEELLAEGDGVAARWTGYLTHTAEFYGFAATGKRVSFSGVTIYHLRDGKIVSARPAQDLFGFFQQLKAE